MNGIKNKINFLITEYRKANIPLELLQKPKQFMIIGTLLLYISAISLVYALFSGVPITLCLFPLFLALSLILVSILSKLSIVYNGYTFVEGECVNSFKGSSRIIKKTFVPREFLVNTELGVISILAIRKKDVPIAGQRIRIYIPKKTFSYKDKNGIIHFEKIYNYIFLGNND